MKKFLMICACLLAVGFLGFYAYYNIGNEKKTEQIYENVSAEYKQNVTPVSSSYMVKEYKGKLAVFESGKSEPFRTEPVEVDRLPEVDQKMLAMGIVVNSQEELSTVLEDYCS